MAGSIRWLSGIGSSSAGDYSVRLEDVQRARPEAPLNIGGERKTYGLALIVAIAIGIGGRLAYVGRPFDHRQLAPWREADYVQLARNFDRDGLNILYPRIDWRENTPGYAEMELPAVPWVAAILYRLFGYHEFLLRIPSTVLGIASLFLFVRLARKVLPPVGVLVATTAFAVSPLLIFLANAMQPDPVMLFFSLLAVDRLWAWEDDPKPRVLMAASLATAAAVLAKSPAACLGVVLVDAVLRTQGARAFTSLQTYLAGALAVLPPAAWYVWANHFWREYGNSLGVSNESHYLWLDMLWPPKFLLGLATHEGVAVFGPAGILLAAAALWRGGSGVRRIVPWYAAALAFYLVTARTSAVRWSFYYHALSVAPAALLMGAGAAGLLASGKADHRPVVATLWLRRAGVLLAAAAIVGLACISVVLIHKRDSNTDWRGMHECAQQFARDVPPGETIVARGGPKVDEYGWPVAHNESMLFAWMDRTGFNYPDEDLNAATLDRIAARGGRFWVAAEGELDRHQLRAEATQRYRRVARCAGGYELFDLKLGPPAVSTEPTGSHP